MTAVQKLSLMRNYNRPRFLITILYFTPKLQLPLLCRIALSSIYKLKAYGTVILVRERCRYSAGICCK